MKILFSCSNPYQIMIAALLKLQLLKDCDTADIIITDTFRGYDNVADRIKDTRYFESVYLIKAKNIIVANSFGEKINKLKFLFTYKTTFCKIIDQSKKYDVLFYNNEDIYTFNLISYLKILNKNCNICRYEEGYSSYTNIESSSPVSKRIIDFRNRIFKKPVSTESNEFYVFEPEMLMRNYDAKIKKIERSFSNMKVYQEFISNIFSVDEVLDNYKKKYIIFEESFVNDGFDIDDFELYEKIIEILGKENVIIKLHPRSSQNRFVDLGVEVKVPDGVPWEAIALCADFDHVVLFALGSGSVINSRLLLGSNIKAFLLFKCLKKRPVAFNDRFEIFVEKFNAKYGNDVFIPESMRDALTAIRNLVAEGNVI